MVAETLTGSRIRERRLITGLRQADLARKIGISASYLNLIEHNRRRIGGKLLNALAEALAVDVSVLTQGAEASLIAALREAEANTRDSTAELDRIDDFTGRFPGWARMISTLHRRSLQLEQVVENLNDRLTHDPKLASSVHEVLSTAASIRSTASILAETGTLEPEWLDRFHANIDEDSQRLAASSRELARYLEGESSGPVDEAQLPQDEVDAFFAAQGYTFEQIEAEGYAAIPEVVRSAELSADAKHIARTVLQIYAADAQHLPLDKLRAYLAANDPSTEPLAIADALDVPVSIILRRLSCLPELETGYVLSDRAGALIWRKPVPGFSLPRVGAACPLWPSFAVLSQPGSVMRINVVQAGRQAVPFVAYAAVEPAAEADYNRAPVMRAGMLLRPGERTEDAVETGSTCRLCARDNCPVRREPSFLMGRT